jgi:hypothetical protein
MKPLLCFLMIVCAVMAAATRPQGEIGSSERLGMSISHDETASGPGKAMQFQVKFNNLTHKDLTFIPGTLVFCGITPSKTSLVKLKLTDGHGKEHRHLPYLGDGPPYQGFCGGQIEFYVVVLHGGESITLPLDIGKYVDLSDAKQYVGARFPAGDYSLQAELSTEPSEITPDLKTTNVWTGRIVSNNVPVQFVSEFSAPMGDYPR